MMWEEGGQVEAIRKTTQEPVPRVHPRPAAGKYDIYPGHPVGPGEIAFGYEALAQAVRGRRRVIIEGYVGVLWEHFRDRLDAALRKEGRAASWSAASTAMRPESEVNALVKPFLGGEDPLFGTRCTKALAELFDPEKLSALRPDPEADLSVIYGPGASLAGWEGMLVYVEVPKNEIQFRSRAGSITNLGMGKPDQPKRMYKQFYFVDWVLLEGRKAGLAAKVDLFVDEQRPDEPALISGDALRAGLKGIARNYFRVRPWFEPGPWGGQWMREQIPELPQDVPNYAWSFELIVPENGLLLESDGKLLEVSFDWLMYLQADQVLGDFADRFGFEFPIRFDFLDTMEGGNLSIQVHPRPEFIREHFGETFTQDESYYILDCKPGARVYLGFQEDIDPQAFREALERSHRERTRLAIDRFVHSVPSHKHDLFLIPNGTIHGSGADNLVLEISATPYIFTFKMYDWQRLDLSGQPRPLNIARAFANLYFDRKGDWVEQHLIPTPRLLRAGDGWQVFHLPTHKAHFYDVYRYEFSETYRELTAGSPHVLSLVEGRSVLLETSEGRRQRFNYAETFVVPAGAGGYRLVNEGEERAKVVRASLKADWFARVENDWLQPRKGPTGS
jgi:mannose-6-phosphate isomerase class I